MSLQYILQRQYSNSTFIIQVHWPTLDTQKQKRGIYVFLNKFRVFLKVHFESVLQLNLFYNKYFDLAVF